VGHSLGANLGAILAAQTRAIQYFILMACPPDLPEFYQQMNEADIQKIKEQTAKERFDIWLSMLLPLEAKNYLPQTQAHIFFQFAEDDEYISTESANNLFELTPQPKEIKFYSGGHLLNRLAEQDRWNSLITNLKNK
jgi:esterase/lipase